MTVSVTSPDVSKLKLHCLSSDLLLKLACNLQILPQGILHFSFKLSLIMVKMIFQCIEVVNIFIGHLGEIKIISLMKLSDISETRGGSHGFWIYQGGF